LYLLRIALAPSITLRGLRQIVLDATPVFTVATARRACGKPLAHQTEDHDPGPPVPGFRTKKAAFLSRYRSHPEHGNRSAAELAPLAGLQAGTGRTYLAEELRKFNGLAAGPRPAEEDDDQPAG
jgi:hypothetical protein